MLFFCLGLIFTAPTRKSPKRSRDTIRTLPEKSRKSPRLQTPLQRALRSKKFNPDGKLQSWLDNFNPGFKTFNSDRKFQSQYFLGQKSCRTKVPQIFRIVFPGFCPRILLRNFPEFLRSFRASFRGKRRPEKIHQKSPPFFNANSQANAKKIYSRNLSGEEAKSQYFSSWGPPGVQKSARKNPIHD